VPGSTFATLLTSLLKRFNFSFKTIDAITHATAIRFEFRFTRTSTADAAG
jgi:uncharacterized protein YecE (DUF72 family)